MDQSTFYGLTGIPLTPQQQAIFGSIAQMAGEQLSEALGWPLNPQDWDNQYTELGKLPEPESWDFDWDWDIDLDNLDPPDEVVGQLRQYRWDEDDRYLSIDPAVKINAVKLAWNNVTVLTLNPQHYRFQWVNGPQGYGKYIEKRPWTLLTKWLLFLWAPMPELMFGMEHQFVQLVVDADWGFANGLPIMLQRAWAEQIAYELDLKRDIKSETMLGHSYSKDARVAPVVKYASTLQKYAGPNSTAIKPGYLA